MFDGMRLQFMCRIVKIVQFDLRLTSLLCRAEFGAGILVIITPNYLS